MLTRSTIARLHLLLAAVSLSFACTPFSIGQTARTFAQQTPNKTQTNQTLTLKQGQVISLTAPVTKAGSEQSRKRYFEQAFPLARKEGLTNALTLKTIGTVVGDFNPEAFIFYMWPSKQAEANFNNNPLWPAIRATRPDSWDHLRIYNSDVDKGKTITFNADKHYSLAVAWTNPERPDDYRTYLSNIEDTVTKLGGRFVFKLENIRYQSHTPPFDTPGQVTFVEWDTKEGLTKLGSTDGFKQNAHLLRSGTTRFELHRVAAVP